MKTLSIVVDGPDIGRMRQALLPKLEGYQHDVFYRAGGKVVTIAFEKYYFRNNSNLLGVVTIDGTDTGRCTVDIVSGGGATGMLGIDWGAEGNAVDILLGMLEEISGENGWTVRECPDGTDEPPQLMPSRRDRRDPHRRHGRRSMRVRYRLRGQRDMSA